MDHAGNLIFVFGFYGDTITVVTHSDDGILKIIPAGTVYHGSELAVNLLTGKGNAASDVL